MSRSVPPHSPKAKASAAAPRDGAGPIQRRASCGCQHSHSQPVTICTSALFTLPAARSLRQTVSVSACMTCVCLLRLYKPWERLALCVAHLIDLGRNPGSPELVLACRQQREITRLQPRPCFASSLHHMVLSGGQLMFR